MMRALIPMLRASLRAVRRTAGEVNLVLVQSSAETSNGPRCC
jgi:hypothetical protein